MKAKHVMSVVFSSLLPLAVYPHDCSGGADGGMDATGNQCNGEVAPTLASSDHARTAAAHPTKLDARKPAACSKCQSKSRVSKRNAAEHSRAKHG
jgi:hypothetical protein